MNSAFMAGWNTAVTAQNVLLALLAGVLFGILEMGVERMMHGPNSPLSIAIRKLSLLWFIELFAEALALIGGRATPRLSGAQLGFGLLWLVLAIGIFIGASLLALRRAHNS